MLCERVLTIVSSNLKINTILQQSVFFVNLRKPALGKYFLVFQTLKLYPFYSIFNSIRFHII